MTRPFKIAAIAGDGIGKEVLPEGLKVLESAAKRFNIAIEFTHFEWASCDYYLKTGDMMPPDWKDRLSGMDAIYFGAVGWPATVPDHISLWGSLLKFRREFDQYINLRPVRLFEGVPCPLANRKPGDIDFYVVAPAQAPDGGDQVERHRDQHAVVGRAGRCHGRGLSRQHGRQAAHRHPHRALRAAAAALRRGGGLEFVRRHPVGPGPACTGTIGLAPSGNLNPERRFPSLFEPVHGSAPDIAGKGIANPIAMIWSGAMMLGFLADAPDAPAGCRAAHDAIVGAIEQVLRDGPRAGDLGGKATTVEIGDAIAAVIG